MSEWNPDRENLVAAAELGDATPKVAVALLVAARKRVFDAERRVTIPTGNPVFLVWVEKPNLHATGKPALVVVKAADPSRHLVFAKEIAFPAGAKLRQAYPGEPVPVEPIRAWIEAERVVADGVEIR